jgi:hypothetical protein
MKFLRNKNAPPLADMVQEFIDSAYDKVVAVYSQLDVINEVADWLALGETYVTAEEMTAAIEAAVEGLFDYKGGYDASTDTPSIVVDPSGVRKGDAYTVTVAGTFYGQNMEIGDSLFAEIDTPNTVDGWTVVNKNIDTDAFATAAQGLLADSAIQPEDLGSAAYTDALDYATAAQGSLAASALQPGAPVSALNNDLNWADDQTPAEIRSAYDSEVPFATQPEMEAGVVATHRRMSPERVYQAIMAIAGKSLKTVRVTSGTPILAFQEFISDSGLTHNLPLAPAEGTKCAVVDHGRNASNLPITILRNGQTIEGVAEDFNINVDAARVEFFFTGGTWTYTYALQVYEEVAPDITYRIVTGTTDTLLLADNGKEVIYTNVAGCAVTLPNGFGIGWNCIITDGSGTPPVVTPVTDTINGAAAGVSPSGQWKGMHIGKYAATEYVAKF